MKRILILCAALAAACDQEPKPEAPTAAEARRLDEAEAMLNAMDKEHEPAREGAGQPVNK